MKLNFSRAQQVLAQNPITTVLHSVRRLVHSLQVSLNPQSSDSLDCLHLYIQLNLSAFANVAVYLFINNECDGPPCQYPFCWYAIS